MSKYPIWGGGPLPRNATVLGQTINGLILLFQDGRLAEGCAGVIKGSIEYAEAIKKARKTMSWSVSDMAEELGVSPRTIEGYAQGRRPNQTVMKLLFLLINRQHPNNC